MRRVLNFTRFKTRSLIWIDLHWLITVETNSLVLLYISLDFCCRWISAEKLLKCLFEYRRTWPTLRTLQLLRSEIRGMRCIVRVWGARVCSPSKWLSAMQRNTVISLSAWMRLKRGAECVGCVSIMVPRVSVNLSKQGSYVFFSVALIKSACILHGHSEACLPEQTERTAICLSNLRDLFNLLHWLSSIWHLY